MRFFNRIRTLYILHRYPIQHTLWESTQAQLPFVHNLSAVEKAHLRELTTLFLHNKHIYGVQGFNLTEDMRVIIAVQACLPILRLGFSLLEGWLDVLVYPNTFRVSRDELDEFGIVHHEQHLLSGESWLRGPIILSWQEIENDKLNWQRGHNVVIHEIAHKLDALNGRANGMPPLHYGMPIELWTNAFSEAYAQLNERVAHHRRVLINPYAATSPAEFFAVLSEYFFCAPEILEHHFSAVYQQLLLYYRQDTCRRLCQRVNN